MNVDDALSAVGGGRFRVILLSVCFNLNTLLGANLHLMSIISPRNETPTGLNGLNHTTLNDFFSLSESQSSIISGVYAAGLACGAVSSGQLADAYGRKPVLIINLVLMSIAFLISAFASTWQVFACERFFTGIFQGGATVANFLLLYELTESAYAGTVAIFYVIFGTLGILLASIMGFLLASWKLVIIGISCQGVWIPIALYFFIPESCRWLYAIGNTERAEEVIANIAKRNKKDDSDIRLARDIGRNEIAGVKTLSSLLGLPNLRTRLLLGISLWLLASSVYSGVKIGAPGLDVGVYWRQALSSGLQILVCFIVMFEMYHKKLGRKGTLIIYLAVAALSLELIAITYDVHRPIEVTTCLEIFSKIGATGAYALMYLYTAEMFPNQVRGVALGLITFTESAGEISAHYINKLESTAAYLPYAILGSMALIAGAVALLLPRTLNKVFPSMLQFSAPYRHLDSDSDEFSINDGD